MNVLSGISRMVSDAGWRLGLRGEGGEDARGAGHRTERDAAGVGSSRHRRAASLGGMLPIRVAREHAGADGGGRPEDGPADAALAEEAGDELEADESSLPRSRQEMLSELRRNYAEAVNLMRKVDGHLSRQEARTQRLAEIAERLPEVIDGLDRLARNQSEQAGAVSGLSESVRTAHAMQEKAASDQLEALGRVEVKMDSIGQSEQQLGESLQEFRGAVAGMAGSNDRIGSALEQLNARDRQRDEQIREMAERGRRTMHVLVGVCALAALATMVAAAGTIALALGG